MRVVIATGVFVSGFGCQTAGVDGLGCGDSRGVEYSSGQPGGKGLLGSAVGNSQEKGALSLGSKQPRKACLFRVQNSRGGRVCFGLLMTKRGACLLGGSRTIWARLAVTSPHRVRLAGFHQHRVRLVLTHPTRGLFGLRDNTK
ncbi:hypothetical protein Tco_0295014 [Tanacetum coccineum]